MISPIVRADVSFRKPDTSKAEIFYQVTIMISRTLGTALGDWVADANTADPGDRPHRAVPDRQRPHDQRLA